ncbi:MAG: hypothetical protein K0Q95_777 [Bacteroidota bacterium]|jgi:hypothetical protein|nr:hypothetical protein [Bacteroidota bacterium]
MNNSSHTYHTNTGNTEKYCRHPFLREGLRGEKVCVNCGRTVYSGQTKGNKELPK